MAQNDLQKSTVAGSHSQREQTPSATLQANASLNPTAASGGRIRVIEPFGSADNTVNRTIAHGTSGEDAFRDLQIHHPNANRKAVLAGNAELADRAGVTAATLWRRLDRLRDRGILRAVETRIDWRALGYAVEVSLRFTLDKTNPRAFDEFVAALRQVPEVIEIQSFLGSVDWRASVIARDMAHWQQVYRDRILTLPHIAELDALMLVATIKDSGELAL